MLTGRRLIPFAIAIVALAALFLSPRIGHTAPSGVLLSGSVKSASGDKVDGVVISAREDGRTITTSVFTDENGNFYFPATLEAGKYRVWAQAEGFEYTETVMDLNGSAAQHDFVLNPAKDFVKQLTAEQYMAALPEDTPQHRRMKAIFYNNCTGCHPPSYPLQNRFDEQGWAAVLKLMNQLVSGEGNYGGADQAPWPTINYYKKELAAYLAEMRGPGNSPMQIKLPARPTGDPARTVITEYDVPVPDAQYVITDNGYATNNGSNWSKGTPSKLNNVAEMHDAQMDMNGNIWFTNNDPTHVRSLAMVNTKTGEVTEVGIPGANGFMARTHGLTMDQKGNLWFTVSGAQGMEGFNGGIGTIDPNTTKFQVFPPTKGMAGVSGSIDVDNNGNIWASTSMGAARFNPQTQQFTEFRSVTPIDADGNGSSYGIAADRDGNGWWTQINIDLVGKSDIHTGEAQKIVVPPRPSIADGALSEEDRKMNELSGTDATDLSTWWHQGPRRLGADKNGDMVWVCDYWGGNVIGYNIHTMQSKMYKYPTPESAPYDAVVDKDHNVWVNLTNGDAVAKLDPKTGTWTEYPLPTHGLELRHISLANHNGEQEVVLGYDRVGRVARIQFRSKADLQALKSQAQQSEAQARLQ